MPKIVPKPVKAATQFDGYKKYFIDPVKILQL